MLGHLLAGGSTVERLDRAVPALAAVAVTGVIGSLLRSASTSATGGLEPKVQRVATERYLSLVARVELSAIEDDEFHRLLDSAGYGADSARRMVKYCTAVLNSLISLAAAAGVLTVLHVALLPLLVAMTLPSAWSSLTIAKMRYVSFHQFVQHARAGQLLGRLLIDQQAAAEVRVHDVGPFLLTHFRGMAQTSEREQTRLARESARRGLLADGATGLATVFTYGVLGVLLWTGGMELSVAGTAVLAIRTGSASLDQLVLQITDLHQEALFVADFEKLCVEARDRAIPTTGVDLPVRVEEIRFAKVTFTYPGSTTPEPSLRDVDVTIPAGKIVALVGSNGSGKSTLVKLLCGLYQPEPGSGRVLWGDVDTAEADRFQIFGRVAMVAQDFYRWPFTVMPPVKISQTRVSHRWPNSRRSPAQTARPHTATSTTSSSADSPPRSPRPVRTPSRRPWHRWPRCSPTPGGMVQLSREQARGRAGDFEIIEYILRAQPGGVPGTWGHYFDGCLLHAPLTDQHRNKIAHQAALIESALGSDPADVPSTAPRARHRPPHPADRVRRRRRPAPSRTGSPAPRRPPGPQRRRPQRPPVRPHTPAARDPRPDRRGPLATSCAPPPIWPPTTAPSIWSWPEASSTTSKNASPEP
ncbi:ATP-binding cassette domain-containing protein [Streptomyces sp. NPDC058239]|uniref:ATP-binding cassette domain-containing protein n=1 Tax=Streptomyces sp. NPDC058239 TaxID=3346395 RepID=UPI0036E6A00C